MKVVLVASDSEHSRALCHFLCERVDVVGIVVDPPVSSKKLLLRRMRRLGRSTALSQLAFRLTIQEPLVRLGTRRRAEVLRSAELRTEPFEHAGLGGDNAVMRGHSINTNAVRETLARWSPDLVVLHGTRIVGKKTIGCVSAPWVNLHAGITPTYRGVHGGWWALAEQSVEDFGATVHRVDAGIDTGEILAQERATPKPQDHFGTYPSLQFVAALRALDRVLSRGLPLQADKDKCGPLKSDGSALRFHPTVGEYFRAWWFYGVR